MVKDHKDIILEHESLVIAVQNVFSTEYEGLVRSMSSPLGLSFPLQKITDQNLAFFEKLLDSGLTLNQLCLVIDSANSPNSGTSNVKALQSAMSRARMRKSRFQQGAQNTAANCSGLQPTEADSSEQQRAAGYGSQLQPAAANVSKPQSSKGHGCGLPQDEATDRQLPESATQHDFLQHNADLPRSAGKINAGRSTNMSATPSTKPTQGQSEGVKKYTSERPEIQIGIQLLTEMEKFNDDEF